MIPMNNTTERPFVLHTRVVTGVGGGPEKTILNSPRFLHEQGFDSACVFMHPPNDPGFEELHAKAIAADAEILSVPDRGPLDTRVVKQLAEICRERNVAIWHAHDYKSNVLGCLLKKKLGIRLVSTVHGWVKHTWKTPLYYAVDRLSLKRYERVLCVSPDLYERCRSLGISDEKLLLVDNGIDASAYQYPEKKIDTRQALNVPSTRLLIGAIGRLSEEKGFDRLIDSVKTLVSSGMDVGLLIAGEGDQQQALTQQIREHGLEERVRLTGFLSDPRQLLSAIDVFALSSLREGLPNVVLEAMASRRAIVATRIAGVPRAITDGVSGLLVEPGDTSALTAALRTCLESPELREKLAEAALRTVEEKFSFHARMDRVANIYRDLLPGVTSADEAAMSASGTLTVVGESR